MPKKDPIEINDLHDAVASFYYDPVGFVYFAFEWGEGDLEGFEGPDSWQIETLRKVEAHVKAQQFDGVNAVDPLQMATSSGHGIGKSCLTAWLILWIMSTRPYCKGVVTANTSDQLKTKTWGEVGKWLRRCVTADWFEYHNTKGNMNLVHAEEPETWRVDAQTCREENSESFAGLHAANSTPFFIFDEACHRADTEVLSDRGWILFSDITEQDSLLTMGADGDGIFQRPICVHVADYDGDMVEIDRRGGCFSVTPNHRMCYYSSKLPDRLQSAPAGSMSWNNKSVPRVIKWRGEHYDRIQGLLAEDYCSLAGWYITDGSATGGALKIYQKKPAHMQALICLLDRTGLKISVDTDGFRILNKKLRKHFIKHYGLLAKDRRVPKLIKQLSPKLIGKFIDSVVMGDGYHKQKVDVIYTSNRLLAGDYQELILRLGFNAVVNDRGITRSVMRDGRVIQATKPGYVVTKSAGASRLHFRRKPDRNHYSGKVYCATIAGGVLMTRLNGHAMWSCNSAVPETIWEVAKGGLTDGEPLFFAFGNPTRNSGSFFECFNRFRHRWITQEVDSRTAKMTNKGLLKEWIDDYGIDSDFVRVRILGKFPVSGDMQLIPADCVRTAMCEEVRYQDDDPLIMGVDVARGGDDRSVILMRRGRDAKSYPAYLIPGEKTRDSMLLVAKIVDVISRFKPDYINVDETGLGGPIVDRLKMLGHVVNGVNFGARSPDVHYANMRAYMWAKMREWLLGGGVAIKDNSDLERDLISVEYAHDIKDRLKLESKDDMRKRGLSSTDLGDALGLTFAVPAPPKSMGIRYGITANRVKVEYDPFI